MVGAGGIWWDNAVGAGGIRWDNAVGAGGIRWEDVVSAGGVGGTMRSVRGVGGTMRSVQGGLVGRCGQCREVSGMMWSLQGCRWDDVVGAGGFGARSPRVIYSSAHLASGPVSGAAPGSPLWLERVSLVGKRRARVKPPLSTASPRSPLAAHLPVAAAAASTTRGRFFGKHSSSVFGHVWCPSGFSRPRVFNGADGAPQAHTKRTQHLSLPPTSWGRQSVGVRPGRALPRLRGPCATDGPSRG